MSSILAAGTWGWYQTWTSFGWIGGAFREKHRSCFRFSMFFSGACQIWMPGKGSKAAQGDQWKVLTQSRWLRHSCSYQFCHVNLRPTICHKGVTWCLESPFVRPSGRFIVDRRLFLKVSSSSRIKETEKSKESSKRQDIGHGFLFLKLRWNLQRSKVLSAHRAAFLLQPDRKLSALWKESLKQLGPKWLVDGKNISIWQW